MVSSIYRPADRVTTSRIYRCLGCGNEVTCVRSEPFPPCRWCGSAAQYLLARATRQPGE